MVADAKPESGRGCLAALGLGLCAPALALLYGWFAWRLSWWSAALGAGLALLGLATLLSRELSRRLGALGVLLVLGPWLLRVLVVRGSEQVRLTELPGDTGPSVLSRLYPEADGTLVASHLLLAANGLRDPEAARFPEILAQAFARVEPSAGLQPTPAIATYLGQQTPRGFDTIVIRPPEQRVAADAAVVFLHGYAGNFHVYCWELAQAAAVANLVTLCPSVGAQGAWWEPDGAATLAATLDYAHAIGMNRVYLAGLSNGAAGASVLALSEVRRLAGLVLISGTRAREPPVLPVLVVQGSRDQMMPASVARAYAASGRGATYRELDGGHFVFLSQSERVRPLIAEFLSGLEKRATRATRR